MGSNEHSGFKDYTVEMQQANQRKKDEKKKRLTKMWGNSNHEAAGYANFMEEVKKGNKPSLQEMGKLNNLKKEGLTDYIFEKDREATVYVNNVMSEIKKTQAINNELLDGVNA